MGKSPAIPPPIWKKPSGDVLRRLGVPLGQFHHVLDAGAHRVHLLHIARNAVPGIHIAQRRVFPPGHKHGQILLRGGQQPAVLGIDLVRLFEIAREQDLVHELVREETLPGLVGAHPFLQHFVFDAAHRFHLGDARIGDAIHVPRQQLRPHRPGSGRDNAERAHKNRARRG